MKNIEYEKPYIATWYITNKCNLNCSYCFVDIKDKKSNSEISTEDAKKVIDKLADNEIYQLNFAGGEPLLREDILILAKYARNRGMTIQISTNASHNMPSPLEILKAGFQCIQISLDGINESDHDLIRGNGSFKKVIGFINDCKNVGLPIVGAFSIKSDNLIHINNIKNFSEKIGFDLIKIQPIFTSRKENDPYIIRFNERKFLKNAINDFKDSKIETFFSYQSSVMQHKGFKSYCNKDFRVLIILENKSITTCDFDQKNGFGNILIDDYDDLWNRVKTNRKIIGKCECA